MFAVYDDASQNIQNATGPIDDGYITNVVGALPGDALCCAGPEPLDDGELLCKSCWYIKGPPRLCMACCHLSDAIFQACCIQASAITKKGMHFVSSNLAQFRSNVKTLHLHNVARLIILCNDDDMTHLSWDLMLTSTCFEAFPNHLTLQQSVPRSVSAQW